MDWKWGMENLEMGLRSVRISKSLWSAGKLRWECKQLTYSKRLKRLDWCQSYKWTKTIDQEAVIILDVALYQWAVLGRRSDVYQTPSWECLSTRGLYRIRMAAHISLLHGDHSASLTISEAYSRRSFDSGRRLPSQQPLCTRITNLHPSQAPLQYSTAQERQRTPTSQKWENVGRLRAVVLDTHD